MKNASIHERLEIPATLAELEHVHRWTEHLLAQLDIAQDSRHNILLAVSEAVTNAIRHGCNEDDGQTVSILMSGTRDGIDIAVTDCGCGFSPDRLPDPTSEHRRNKPGGRGVFLLKSLAEDVHFDFTPSGTTVTFRFGTH